MSADSDLFLFKMLKGGVDKRTRDMMGMAIAHTLSAKLALPPIAPSAAEAEIVRQLDLTGFAAVAPIFSPADLAEIEAYFADKPISFSDSDLDTTGFRGLLADNPGNLRFGHWDQDVVSGCPQFCRAAHAPSLLRIAEAYLGAPPTVSTLTDWWSFPSTAMRGGMQNFHHDRDDFRLLKVFTYLTDATETTGPHEFIQETHSFNALMSFMSRGAALTGQQQKEFVQWMEQHRKADDDVHKYFPKENILTITGNRGATFFEDTRGLHRGLPPVTGPRLAFEICYTMTPKLSSIYKPIPRACAADPTYAGTTRATRLFYSDLRHE